MNNIFISLRMNSPDGFEQRTPTKRDLLGGRIALLADNLKLPLSLLTDFPGRVRGVIITEGEELSHSSIDPELWHLVVPGEMLPNLRRLVECFFDFMARGQAALDENGSLKIEQMRDRQDRKLLRESYDTKTERLGNIVYELRNEIEERIRLEDELEEQCRQAQKMEAVGQLVGGVAHDFNNLLQVINGYADIARATLNPTHAANASVEEIAKAGAQAKVLVQQLLTFSRQQVIDPVDLHLNKEIEKSQKMLCHLIGEHIQFEFIAGDDTRTVFVDQGQMHQVLMNLCMNARDAMPDGGKLTVQTESLTIGPDDLKTYAWARPGDYVRLSVRDTGCGMDKEICNRIFDPFFTTKEVGKGTGLGLSIVCGIVKQSEGHIEVESKPDQGTVFAIYLPVSQPLSADIIRSTSENLLSPEGGVETLLVVEDDTMILELATYTLTNAGYIVLTAKDGEEAVQVFDQHADEIDLVVMDVVMPRMGGKEAMEKILKKRPSLRHLFVSGYSPDAGHTDFIKKQGASLLSKPYEAVNLLKKTRDMLDED